MDELADATNADHRATRAPLGISNDMTTILARYDQRIAQQLIRDGLDDAFVNTWSNWPIRLTIKQMGHE